MTDDECRFSIPETASISGSSRRCCTVRAPNPEGFRQSMFQNLSLGIEGFLGRWRNHNVFREQIRRTKRTVIPGNTSSNAHRHAHFFRFFWARIGSEEQTAITEVLRTAAVSSSPKCYREAVAAIQLDASGCLRKYSDRPTVPILSIANKLDLIRNRASILNSLSSSGASPCLKL